MDIGAAWAKVSDKGNKYLSISLDKAILELYPQLKNCIINAFYIDENKQSQNENSPCYRIVLNKKEAKTAE